MYKKIDNADVSGKKIIVRCDFNVPLKDGVIQDDTRIREALPTINYLLANEASIILMSHLGRPKGEKVDKYSLKPVAEKLSQIIGKPVKFCPEAYGDIASDMSGNLRKGDVLLLENLRFYPGEEGNDPEFAKNISLNGDIFIQDAFGTVHRKHASMVGIPAILPAFAGKLLQKEIDYLSKGLQPEHPLVVILGGAKLQTKIPIIENMLKKADTILVGGGMAYTFLKVQGHQIGRSLLDEQNISTAEKILDEVQQNSLDMLLPVDHIATDDLDDPKNIEKTGGADIPADLIGVDIGDKTLEQYKKKIMSAKTIILNGPMGVFEKSEFESGTKRILEAVIESTRRGASSIAGGGDTVSAIKNLGFDTDSFTHVSTGGGASLKFLEGKDLPGIIVLEQES
ncbi:phosphoglycerate kinase [Elusimicrobiota bacterium]